MSTQCEQPAVNLRFNMNLVYDLFTTLFMKLQFFSLFFLITLGITACQKPADNTAKTEAKRYDLKGKVVSVNKAEKKATIDHAEIPDYMPAMTMEFPIHEDWVWDDLTPGSEIRAKLVVDSSAKDPYWLEQIGIVAAVNPNQTPLPVNENFAQVGKEVPNFELTNQDGKRLSLKDYRGKALAITFIYAQCPLPDYCIKMSKNFSDLAIKLAAEPEEKDRVRLLSISFDPERDTPEKLKYYGLGYLGKDAKPDFNIWQLAVGSDKQVRAIADFFGLRYEVDPNDKTQFSHSLRTAIISPAGKVTKIFSGNDWTADDLLKELEATIE
jgi:protein SCO1/2